MNIWVQIPKYTHIYIFCFEKKPTHIVCTSPSVLYREYTPHPGLGPRRVSVRPSVTPKVFWAHPKLNVCISLRASLSYLVTILLVPLSVCPSGTPKIFNLMFVYLFESHLDKDLVTILLVRPSVHPSVIPKYFWYPLSEISVHLSESHLPKGSWGR